MGHDRVDRVTRKRGLVSIHRSRRAFLVFVQDEVRLSANRLGIHRSSRSSPRTRDRYGRQAAGSEDQASFVRGFWGQALKIQALEIHRAHQTTASDLFLASQRVKRRFKGRFDAECVGIARIRGRSVGRYAVRQYVLNTLYVATSTRVCVFWGSSSPSIKKSCHDCEHAVKSSMCFTLFQSWSDYGAFFSGDTTPLKHGNMPVLTTPKRILALHCFRGGSTPRAIFGK